MSSPFIGIIRKHQLIRRSEKNMETGKKQV